MTKHCKNSQRGKKETNYKTNLWGEGPPTKIIFQVLVTKHHKVCKEEKGNKIESIRECVCMCIGN
jgi:hypothetical protein